MAHRNAGPWDQWTPPSGATGDGGAGSSTGVDGRLIRELVTALGASVVNTNNSIVSLGQQMAQSQNNSNDHGYRLLKPKKDVVKITADIAEELMVEMAQFEVDLGELGVPTYSEAAHRQLRAAATGKAREVLELEQVNGGPISKLLYQLNSAVNQNQSRQLRDQYGGELHASCYYSLAVSVRLTPAKRLEIAERLDAEAKMYHDTVAEAEAFIGRWRRARHLLYRERLVGPPADFVEQQMQATGTDPLTIEAVVQQLRSSERREMNRLMEERIAPGIYSLIKSCEGTPEAPTTVEQCMGFVDRWIVMHKSPQPKGG